MKCPRVGSQDTRVTVFSFGLDVYVLPALQPQGAFKRTEKQSFTRAHVPVGMHALKHAQTYARAQTHTRASELPSPSSPPPPPFPPPPPPRARTHTHTHTHTNARTHARTHTHTLAHTHSLSLTHGTNTHILAGAWGFLLFFSLFLSCMFLLCIRNQFYIGNLRRFFLAICSPPNVDSGPKPTRTCQPYCKAVASNPVVCQSALYCELAVSCM